MNPSILRPFARLQLALLFILQLAPPMWAAAPGPTREVGKHRAVLTQIVGQVEIKVLGKKEWLAGKPNQELRPGDMIRTGPASTARVKISDVGEVALSASTEVTVGDLKQVKTNAKAFFVFQRMVTRDDVGLDLKKGDLKASFNQVAGRVGNYNVQTPVAVAGVRGTKFELDLEGGRSWHEQMQEGKGDGDEFSLTTIVFDGEVLLSGANWSRSVKEGQQLTALMGRMPGNVQQADPKRLQSLAGDLADAVAPTFNGATSMERTTPTSLKVTWSPASDNRSPAAAIMYDIYSAQTPGGQNFTVPNVTTPPGVTNAVFNNVDADKNYFIVVRARDEAGNRDANTREVSTSAQDLTPPTFSGAAGLTPRDDGSLVVSWEAASDDKSSPAEIAYDVFVATSEGGHDFSSPTARTDSAATSHVLSGLDQNQTYHVVVRARDAAGNSDRNTREVSIGGAAADETPPAFSGVESLQKLSANSLIVSWQPGQDDETEEDELVYDLYVAKTSKGQEYSRPTATTNPGATNFEMTGLDEKEKYYIVVRARDEAGNSDENTREVTTHREDKVPPTFEGAATGVEVGQGNLEITWPEAKDNLSSPTDIVYDVFVSSTKGGQDFFSRPEATSSPGVLSLSFYLSREAAPVYYVVVRARDEAGNSDGNTKEIEIRSPTYIASEVERVTQALYDAYSYGNTNGFMEFVSTSFAGVNSGGNALTYGTLGEALQSDFRILSSVEFDYGITSVREVSADRVLVSVTWNGIFRFTSSGKETNFTGKTTTLAWDVSKVPMQLIAWEGDSPFGLTEPLSGETQGDIAPFAVTSVDGDFTFAISGDQTDFAPRTYVIRGSGFREGVTAEVYENDFGYWFDATTDPENSSFSAYLEYVSSGELRIHVTAAPEKWCPSSQSGATPHPDVETVRYRLVNPDGSVSNEITTTHTTTAGALTVSEAKDLQSGAGISNEAGQHSIAVIGYNFVLPVSITISDQGAAPVASSSWSNVTFLGASCEADGGGAGGAAGLSQDPYLPTMIVFSADLAAPVALPASFDITITDARGQTGSATIAAASPGAPFLSSATVTPSTLTLTGDFNSVAPTVQVFGGNFNPGQFVEMSDFGNAGPWVVVNNPGDPPTGGFRSANAATFVSASEFSISFNAANIKYYDDGDNDGSASFTPFSLRVRDPVSSDITTDASVSITIVAGPPRISPGTLSPTTVTEGATGAAFGIEGYNFVTGLAIFADRPGMPGTPDPAVTITVTSIDPDPFGTDPTQPERINFEISVAIGCDTGLHDIRIVNPGGATCVLPASLDVQQPVG